VKKFKNDRRLANRRFAPRWLLLAAAIGFVVVAATASVSTQLIAPVRDPGVRGGPPGGGQPFAELSANELAFFARGQDEFSEADEVDEGLGPRMNLDSCGGCHAQPAIGGSSPAINPQIEFATRAGDAGDKVPPFLRLRGPVREARFVRNPDGTADGGVTALFTITGRDGVGPGCVLRQADFAGQLANRNVIFRIPTPVFGAGLIEQIEDSAILANQAANGPQKRLLGIRGRPNIAVSGRTISGAVNRNGNDGTITRFGWKAQNVSLLLFSGEAYNVEMGITSELFQNEREQDPNCYFAPIPNDTQDMNAADAVSGTTAIQSFANFQRLLAPPQPSTNTLGGSVGRGRALFESAGCALCHTPSLQTSDTSKVEALRNKTANLFSDLLVHDMGVGLADGISQGQAGPREFRTAPLWGLGQRIFFLHDGRTSNLLEAIQGHQSLGSEANGVIGRFNGLGPGQQQDIINFLRSL
jgi:CxxC motif-containing protein (DUF1111 family)